MCKICWISATSKRFHVIFFWDKYVGWYKGFATRNLFYWENWLSIGQTSSIKDSLLEVEVLGMGQIPEMVGSYKSLFLEGKQNQAFALIRKKFMCKLLVGNCNNYLNCLILENEVCLGL
jgi:hypothetical protein